MLGSCGAEAVMDFRNYNSMTDRSQLYLSSCGYRSSKVIGGDVAYASWQSGRVAHP